MTPRLSRRLVLLLLAALAACRSAPPSPSAPPAPPAADPFQPIVFVHGNGETAALWMTTLWRFESNGWPRAKLHAIDMPYPLARDDDTKPQDGRNSTSEAMQFLAAEVDKVLKATGASKVVLIANSRGGYAVRNYVANGGGAAKVSHVVLAGTPNHGVWADVRNRPDNEFNGAGPFLTGLNAPKGPNGEEVTPGVRWMTIRSDNNDKYAQPDGAWIGAKGTPTNVFYDGPALKGAQNMVIVGADHRELAFGPKAFAGMFRFVTGRDASSTAITPETSVVLDGKVSGQGLNNEPGKGSFPTNLPLAGATVEVYACRLESGERNGPAVHRKTVGADGRWGPFNASPRTFYEIVVSAPGYATTHIYRSPFPRSSAIVHLRLERIADVDRDARSIVTLTRPRGYFGVPRDQVELDERSPPGGIPPGVAGVSAAKLKLLDAPNRAVSGEFNGERIVGRAWPAADNHVVFLELTY
ncbi:MAG TPA: alpha/beta fold hydrolase [Albitalea sp.]|uniref:alpha/beta fold hydrolase n=1 Tax=Piscinibacter sp. TaxID=1903157 RepID=UPI002ED00ABD